MSEPAPQHTDSPSDSQGLHPDAPRQNSPWKWMLLMMAVLVVLTTYSMWGKEKISIKATATIPELTPAQQAGRTDFAKFCQECHGVDGTGGTRTGQPLLHPMYRENVFPDFVLKKAMRDGKREKNWRFGDMKPISGLTETQIDNITAYLRAVQVASGID